MVWLGAEPPQDCDRLREKHTNENLGTPLFPSLRKARLYNLLKVVIVLLFFLFLVVGYLLAGEWQIGMIIAGIMAAIVLFAISYLFQAVIVLFVAIYLFSQGHWLIGLAMLALTLYLIFASTLRDEDIIRSFIRVGAISPWAYNLLNEYNSQRNRLQERKKKLNQKLKAIGKPPMKG
jgi:hypothetical protein